MGSFIQGQLAVTGMLNGKGGYGNPDDYSPSAGGSQLCSGGGRYVSTIGRNEDCGGGTNPNIPFIPMREKDFNPRGGGSLKTVYWQCDPSPNKSRGGSKEVPDIQPNESGNNPSITCDDIPSTTLADDSSTAATAASLASVSSSGSEEKKIDSEEMVENLIVPYGISRMKSTKHKFNMGQLPENANVTIGSDKGKDGGSSMNLSLRVRKNNSSHIDSIDNNNVIVKAAEIPGVELSESTTTVTKPGQITSKIDEGKHDAMGPSGTTESPFLNVADIGPKLSNPIGRDPRTNLDPESSPSQFEGCRYTYMLGNPYRVNTQTVLPFFYICKFDKHHPELGGHWWRSPSGNGSDGGSMDYRPLGEPLFIPKKGWESRNAGEEDDGWVITQRNDLVRRNTSFVVLDARTMTMVCEIVFDLHIPYGVYGCWVAEGEGLSGALKANL